MKWLSFPSVRADAATTNTLLTNEGFQRVLRELIADLGLELVVGSSYPWYKVVSFTARTFFLRQVDMVLWITHKWFRLRNCQGKVEEDPNAAYYAAYREFDDGPLVLLGKWKESPQNNNDCVTVNTITRNGAPINHGAPAPHDRCELDPAQAPVLQGFGWDQHILHSVGDSRKPRVFTYDAPEYTSTESVYVQMRPNRERWMHVFGLNVL